MAQEVFAEHLGVISALCDNYERTEDAAAVAGLVRAQHEVAAACTAREQQVKEVIKGKEEKLKRKGATSGCGAGRALVPRRSSSTAAAAHSAASELCT